jgi:hypothetical protein
MSVCAQDRVPNSLLFAGGLLFELAVVLVTGAMHVGPVR